MVHIPDILDYYGIQYKEDRHKPSKLDILCPFHEDHNYGNASFDTDLQVFGCFACHAGGNVFQFVAKMEGISVKEAGELLASNFLERRTYDLSGSQQLIQRNIIRLQQVQQEKIKLAVTTTTRMLREIARLQREDILAFWMPVITMLVAEPPTVKEILEVYQKFQSYILKEYQHE